jgi:molybdate transport system substrate-binding protein
MAASSLTEAFNELAQAFEAANPRVQIELNFASSQQLAQQLSNGARADIFASANRQQMDIAVENGRIDRRDVTAFTRNKLIMVYPLDDPGKISSLSDLAKPGVKVLLAAPDVPVGAYTLEFLEKAAQPGVYGADFKDRVLANTVSYEASPKAVVVKVGLGEADAGIVYATDLTPEKQASLGSIDIPDELNVVAEYFIAPVTDGDRELARLWIEFIRSKSAEELLQIFGFQPLQNP